jgi:hypothetical protein
MLRFVTDDLFGSPVQTLVNPVNTVGVMGKGLALAFCRRFPGGLFADYVRVCRTRELRVGTLFLWRGSALWVLCFPPRRTGGTLSARLRRGGAPVLRLDLPGAGHHLRHLSLARLRLRWAGSRRRPAAPRALSRPAADRGHGAPRVLARRHPPSGQERRRSAVLGGSPAAASRSSQRPEAARRRPPALARSVDSAAGPPTAPTDLKARPEQRTSCRWAGGPCASPARS